MADSLAQRGFAVTRKISLDLASLATVGESNSRDLLDAPLIQDLAIALKDLVEPVLGKGAFAVRGLFFNKTAETNWLVP